MKTHFVLALLCSMTLLSCYKTPLSPGLTDTTPRMADARGLAALAGTTYYVSTTGDDANDGSLGAPFRSINKALSVAGPGDEVQVRGGTYTEKVRFPVSGTKSNFITLREYPDETAIISGAGLAVNGEEALLTIDRVQYIIIEGLDICNFKSSSGRPRGVLVTRGADYIQLLNNQFYGIDYEAQPNTGNSHAILVAGNTTDAVNDITISGNSIHDCRTGTGANVDIRGYVTAFNVSGNTIYNGEHSGIQK